MPNKIVNYYLKNKEGILVGIVWGVVAVAVGSLINQLFDILNTISGIILQVVEWVLVLPATLTGYLHLSGMALYIGAIIVGMLLGPFAWAFWKWLWKWLKKSPV